MLYQLSYALRPHYQVTTFSRGNLAAKQRHCKLLQSLCFLPIAPLRDSQPSLIVESFRRKKRLKRRPLRLENCLAYSCLFRTITRHLGRPRFCRVSAAFTQLSPTSVVRSHLSRTTVSLTWVNTHSSLNLLHDNGCKGSFLSWQRTGAAQPKNNVET